MEKSFYCANEEETRNFGFQLGKLLQRGDFICLEGNLGAGKTTLVKSIAEGMSFIPEDIVSPTFTIMNIYEGLVDLYHFDLYRLTDISELDMIGFYDYYSSDGVVIVEWSNLFLQAMPDECLTISLLVTGSGRNISLKALGKRYEQLCQEVRSANISD